MIEDIRRETGILSREYRCHHTLLTKKEVVGLLNWRSERSYPEQALAELPSLYLQCTQGTYLQTVDQRSLFLRDIKIFNLRNKSLYHRLIYTRDRSVKFKWLSVPASIFY
jgi:hypothetical protein